jgi:arginyl-tRNA synthetase
LKKQVEAIIKDALTNLGIDTKVYVNHPRDPSFGDYTTNVAMLLAKERKASAQDLAHDISQALANPMIQKVEVAGPGFINLRMVPQWWYSAFSRILGEKENFGQMDLGMNKKVQIEFVSANPTGPLHIGHGRGAAVGDSLARILKKAGYQVEKEYYINDAGRQIRMLGESIWSRCMEIKGINAEFPKEGYQGAYVLDLAKEAVEKMPEVLELAKDKAIEELAVWGAEKILGQIKEDLRGFGVEFDSWFNESTLYKKRLVENALSKLKEKGYLYSQDGALWFASSKLEDDKDRVVVKANGDPTYLASDIAYHDLKAQRGFHLLIDIWGADHHGYVSRIKAALEALGHAPQILHVLLVQIVNLIKSGDKVSMSTRQGEFITLSELMAEVGKDAARYTFLTRKCDAHLDFDVDLVKSQTEENPVFYVQYAHTRISSIFRNALDKSISYTELEKVDLSPLTLEEEMLLIKKSLQFPDIIEGIALNLEPHRLTYYLQELASIFHSYYNHHRVLVEDKELREARMALVKGVQIVIKEGLGLLGVDAPHSM